MNDDLQWHQKTMAFVNPNNNERVFRAKTEKPHVPYELELVYCKEDDDLGGQSSDQDRGNCHHEFIRCVQCRKRILYLRSRDDCQACHDALRHLYWSSVPVTNERNGSTDEEGGSRNFLTLRGCFPTETCQGAFSAVQFVCEICGLVCEFCDIRPCRCNICLETQGNQLD